MSERVQFIIEETGKEPPEPEVSVNGGPWMKLSEYLIRRFFGKKTKKVEVPDQVGDRVKKPREGRTVNAACSLTVKR